MYVWVCQVNRVPCTMSGVFCSVKEMWKITKNDSKNFELCSNVSQLEANLMHFIESKPNKTWFDHGASGIEVASNRLPFFGYSIFVSLFQHTNASHMRKLNWFWRSSYCMGFEHWPIIIFHQAVKLGSWRKNQNVKLLASETWSFSVFPLCMIRFFCMTV